MIKPVVVLTYPGGSFLLLTSWFYVRDSPPPPPGLLLLPSMNDLAALLTVNIDNYILYILYPFKGSIDTDNEAGRKSQSSHGRNERHCLAGRLRFAVFRLR